MARRVSQSDLEALADGITTIAVTGTNGKTTTASMLGAIVEAAGQPSAVVTTLGMRVAGELIARDGSMTSFVRALERAREVGVRTVCLEVTSRALDDGFAERWPADIAVFTNMTPDHLDRHGTPERYLAAKARLFVGLRPPGTAVLNVGDPAAALLAEVIPEPVRVVGYRAGPAPQDTGLIPTHLAAEHLEVAARGTRVALARGPLAERLGGALGLAAVGPFNADNALAAALAAHVAGFGAGAVKSGLERFPGLPGRFEVLSHAPLVIVDFAHSPDALERVLQGARALAREREGRVACVFGCGGERDRGKRPRMGALADRLADVVWLTTDNPRGEDPAAIAAMVLAGVAEAERGGPRWRPVPDRRQAIAAAVRWAAPSDVVVIAGRGHEREQHLAGGSIALSDREIALGALAKRV